MRENLTAISAEPAFVHAAANLARAAARPMTSAQQEQGLAIVRARMSAARGRHRRPLFLGGLAILAAATVWVLWGHVPSTTVAPSGALAYRIDGGEIGDGGYVRAHGPNGARLRFAEGTEVHLLDGARGRLTTVDVHGARLAIEEGAAEVSVTPLPHARWLVDAGPFLITVRGTVFTAAWKGTAGQLDIRMKKGLVSVQGPLAEGSIAVRAGQRLTVDLQSRQVVLREIEAEGLDETTGDEQEDVESREPDLGPRPAASNAIKAVQGHKTRSWSATLAAGDLDLILREADRQGIRRALSRSSSEDLAALADAARYRRRDGLARQALLAQRRRFPRSSRASDSAFLLGRMEEDAPHAGARAIAWYDRYLEEAPSGAYASEALGRKMSATKRWQGIAAARSIAEAYLARFPTGTYAGAASAVRDSR